MDFSKSIFATRDFSKEEIRELVEESEFVDSNRELTLKHFVDDKTIPELAREYSLSENSVIAKISKTLKKVRIVYREKTLPKKSKWDSYTTLVNDFGVTHGVAAKLIGAGIRTPRHLYKFLLDGKDLNSIYGLGPKKVHIILEHFAEFQQKYPYDNNVFYDLKNSVYMGTVSYQQAALMLCRYVKSSTTCENCPLKIEKKCRLNSEV